VSAQSVFDAGSDSRKNLLKTTWPDLYAALSGSSDGSAPTDPLDTIEAFTCWFCRQAPGQAGVRVPAVARSQARPKGMPACARHIAEHSDRPGGYPLPGEPRGGPHTPTHQAAVDAAKKRRDRGY